MKVETQVAEKVNVAPKSTQGHFVKDAKQVVCLDEVTEAFFVDGKATLETVNHQTLPMEENCLVMPQQVYNPYTKALERSKD